MSCATSTYDAEIDQYIGRLAPHPLNAAWGVTIGPTSDAQTFAGATLDLSITNADGTRVTLTEADVTLSSGDTVMSWSKNSAWTAANLTAGELDLILLVNGSPFVHLSQLAYVPTGGEVND
jgi:hypothetical protein